MKDSRQLMWRKNMVFIYKHQIRGLPEWLRILKDQYDAAYPRTTRCYFTWRMFSIISITSIAICWQTLQLNISEMSQCRISWCQKWGYFHVKSIAGNWLSPDCTIIKLDQTMLVHYKFNFHDHTKPHQNMNITKSDIYRFALVSCQWKRCHTGPARHADKQL